MAFTSRRGSITIFAAALFAALIAVAGLVVEYGSALVLKAKYQRLADLSAYAGAMAYGAKDSTSALNDAVTRIAVLNGISADNVSAALVSSPTGDGNQAVRVTVSGTGLLALSRVLNSNSDVSISASSYAELKADAPACVIALGSSDAGVTLSGGTSLSAPNCAIESDASVVVPDGTSITTTRLTYNSSTAPSSDTLDNIHAPSGKTLTIAKLAATDPLSNDSSVTAESAHLADLATMTAPAEPNPPPNNNIQFGWSSSRMTSIGGGDCSAERDGSTWTVTCNGDGPFYFGSLSAGGGITVYFNTNGSSTATYDFSGDINGSSGTLFRFGPGTYNIAGGIIVGGGVTMSFDSGTFNVGKLQTSCGAGGGYSICDAGTSLTIAGPSTFSFAGGIYDNGGSILTLGTATVGSTSPTTNSFDVGAAADGNSLNVGGGGITTLADASGSGGVFDMTGNITAAGGSCVVLSAAAGHDIGGSISASGGVYAGAGVYSVNGYVALGANNGGNVTCTVNGTSQSLGLSGTEVTFGIAANSTPGSGPCAGMAFCVAAGYSSVTMTAPGSGDMESLLVVGPTSAANAAGANFTEGASGTSLSGVFYLPYGPISLSGDASVGNQNGQCLELIGSQITLAGGAALASACGGMGGSSGATALLVQ